MLCLTKMLLIDEDQFPDWIAIYFVKVSDNEMKCNLCDITLKVEEKSQELVKHLKSGHKDVYDLHKDNPEATVGFRIEFLNLNILKDDTDSKSQPVILEEVCETASDSIIHGTTATIGVSEIVEKNIADDNMQLVLFDNNKKKKRESTGPRKRSWIWKYFDKLSNIIYRCRLCHVVLSIKGCNSNNMNRHVRTRHPDVFKSEVIKVESIESIHVISDDAPYAIKTEEIYASDKDYLEAPEMEVTESPSQKLRRSWIWSYFNRVSNVQAQCKLCNRQICHGGNATGNMNRHLKMIHNKTASYDESATSWVWKVFETCDNGMYYSCKICQHKCLKLLDTEKSMTDILKHLKAEHGVVSGDQIITGSDVLDEVV